MAAAFLSGYAALRILLKLLEKGRLGGFAYYCWAVGLLAVVMGFLRWKTLNKTRCNEMPTYVGCISENPSWKKCSQTLPRTLSEICRRGEQLFPRRHISRTVFGRGLGKTFFRKVSPETRSTWSGCFPYNVVLLGALNLPEVLCVETKSPSRCIGTGSWFQHTRPQVDLKPLTKRRCKENIRFTLTVFPGKPFWRKFSPDPFQRLYERYADGGKAAPPVGISHLKFLGESENTSSKKGSQKYSRRKWAFRYTSFCLESFSAGNPWQPPATRPPSSSRRNLPVCPFRAAWAVSEAQRSRREMRLPCPQA